MLYLDYSPTVKQTMFKNFEHFIEKNLKKDHLY